MGGWLGHGLASALGAALLARIACAFFFFLLVQDTRSVSRAQRMRKALCLHTSLSPLFSFALALVFL